MKITTRRVTTGEIFPISQPQSQSQSQSQRQDQPSKPYRPQSPALHRLSKFRTIVFPMLIVLVFTSLVLGAIYAYCVANPHTEIADRLAQNSTAEIEGSLFGKRRPSMLSPVSISSGIITPRSASTDDDSQSTEPAATITATTDSTSATTGGSSSSSSSSSSPSSLALLFYTFTTPGISLFHLSMEILIHHHTPHHLTLRRTYLAIMTLSSFLVAGWITTLGFWMHCELGPTLHNQHDSGPTSSSTFRHIQAQAAICPVQVRGHFMYGIHEVSISKAVVGGIIVLVYVCHVVLLGMGFKAQRRVWRLVGIGGGGGLEHGEASEIVIRVEEDEEEDGQGHGREYEYGEMIKS
ncbi:hypothetical protein A1O1_08078 [Capronia coronata CBS 617.96]|uniref:Uncharacterized protein n=1 Tax=Capronia coronata CBS 617.96 TaxID=1182541 RepID=W9XXC2_9EURO|nr:uncharacterized protein A1O1_08078 [Capronia coronata CBS 617.96]EXJ82010.1 hypothetical protein A1O1_08078 [Capronia coronata CBS 617.96]